MFSPTNRVINDFGDDLMNLEIQAQHARRGSFIDGDISLAPSSFDNPQIK